MSKSTRARLLQDANAALLRVARLAPKFERTILDELLGDGASGPGGTGISDPTGSLAVRTNRARTDERQVDRMLRSIVNSAEGIERTMRYWTDDIPLKARELAELERQADPGCEVMARVKRDGKPVFDETYQASTTVGGRLDRPYRLCRWAYDFVRKVERLPTDAEVQLHADGRTVFVRA